MTTPGPESLERNTRTIAGYTLLSRVFGLARDLVLVRVFGDTVVGSAFNAAFVVPNLFRRLFGEGALSGAFLPRYTQMPDEPVEAGDGSTEADRFASLVLMTLAAVTASLVVIGELGLLVWLRSAEPGSDTAYAVGLMMLMLPLMPLVCVTAILGGVLQVRGRFGVPAALPIVINAAIIAAGGWMLLSDAEPRRAGTAIALAAVGAGAVQIAVALRALRGRLRLTVRVRSAAGDAKRTLAAFVPVAVGMGTLQLNTLADTVLAMWPTWIGPTLLGRAVPMDAASNAILGFTQRLYQFPLGVFGLAVATAAFPQLARAAGDPARFAQTIARGARLSLFIGLPASAGLWLVRDDLIRVVFSGGGGFSEHGLARAGAVLAGYAVAVWAYGLNHLLVRSFYARHDTTTPMRISLAMVGVNVGLNLVLIWRFREAGLAWSTAATAVIQTGVLAVLVGRRGGPPPESLVRPVLRTLSATAVMAVAVAGAAAALGLAQDAGGREWSGSLVRLVVMVGVGGGVYLGVARVLRCDELGWLLSRSVKVEREDER